MILASIFYVLSILCFVLAYKTKLDEQQPEYKINKTAKPRLYGLSIFILVLAVINTYLAFNEDSNSPEILIAATPFFLFFIATICFLLAAKKRWGKEDAKPYAPTLKVKLVLILVGILLFVLGVYLALSA